MDWKKFFGLNPLKFLVFILVFLFLPFFTYTDYGTSVCTMGMPMACDAEDPHVEFMLSPMNTGNTINFALRAKIGTGFDFQLLNYNRFFLFIKLICSYLLTSFLFYIIKKY